uniref:Uncharacterized protein n=1 Tax=Anguilla anguilla TaxID=7936 RepID=A0A0E9W6Q9_ANGAN
MYRFYLLPEGLSDMTFTCENRAGYPLGCCYFQETLLTFL